MLPLIMICVSIPFISGIPVSYDTRVFLGENNRHYLDLQRFEETFRRASQTFLLLSYGKETVVDASFAHTIREMTREAWQLPHAIRVDSLANAPYVVRGGGDELIVENVLDYVLAHADSQDRVNDALSSPEYLRRLVSSDGRVAGVVVTFDVPTNTEDDIQNISEAIRQLVADHTSRMSRLNVHITGEVPLMETFGEAAKRDLARLVPITVVVFVAVLLVCLRSLLFTGALVSIAAASICGAMWLFAVSGNLLNSASSLIPMVTLVVLSANSIHLLFGYRKERQKGETPANAMSYALGLNRTPIILAALTTIASFLLLNTADAPPFHDLGNYVAIGVAIGTGLLLSWCPAIIRFFDKRPNIDARGAIDRGLEYVVLRGSALNIGVVGAVIAVGILGLHKLTIDDNFIEYFDADFPIRASSTFAAKHLGGPNYLDLQVSSGRENGVFEPQFQGIVEDFSDWLRRQDITASVSSISDVLKSVNDAFGTAKELRELTEEDLAQYLLTFELSLSAGQSLNDYIDFDRRSTSVNVLLKESSSQDIIRLERDAYAWFASHAPTSFELLVTGITVPTAHMSITNIKAMLVSIVGSMILVAGLVGLYFRSLSLSFLALGAIVLPIAMGFGFWGWIKGSVGMAASAVAALTIGIVIDDAIHIFSRYRILRRAGLQPDHAAIETIRNVGPAVTTTSLALILGFAVLQFSGFEVNRALGLCTALIVGCALLVDLLALPHALAWVDRKFRFTRNPKP
jgi:hypothetical protein